MWNVSAIALFNFLHFLCWKFNAFLLSVPIYLNHSSLVLRQTHRYFSLVFIPQRQKLFILFHAILHQISIILFSLYCFSLLFKNIFNKKENTAFELSLSSENFWYLLCLVVIFYLSSYFVNVYFLELKHY